MSRIETGSVQFGDDWPCVVIRGDNAMYYSQQLNLIKLSIQGNKDLAFVSGQIDGLMSLLGGCNAGPIDKGKSDCQFLKPFEECVKTGENNE